MRDIKFRAWDCVEEKIMPVETINFREQLVSIDEGDNSTTDTFEMFVLMQYTGIKDKNGVEIYEGDILTFMNKKKASEVVEWDDKGASFCMKSIKNESSSGAGLYINEYGWCPYKVIGNIYENPELLEVNK